VDEALWAFTAGGAAALRRSDIGGLAVGQRAHLSVVNGSSSADLAYRASARPLLAVFREHEVTNL
jgi:imidazolonepropionase